MSNEIINVLVENVSKIIISVIGILITSVVLPWFKKDVIPWLKEKELYNIVKGYVKAAEKLKQTEPDIDKHEYVVSQLKKRGIVIDEEVLSKIETAVMELDIEFLDGLMKIFSLKSEEEEANKETKED